MARNGALLSAEKTFTEPPTSEGNKATVKNTMPSPPTHCISERQKRMPWGNRSTSSKTVAPVEVKPDIASR